jgi:glutamyl-tRNA reductase
MFANNMHSDQLTIPDHIISRLFVAGINYHKTDISTRGLFAVDNEGATQILEEAGAAGIRSAFVLSTCNRTEIYGYCQQDQELTDLLIRHTRASQEQFHELAYRKRGKQALQHLFEVAAGLDSQIIGDNEILGQLKHSVALSREQRMIGPIMDRTLNFAFQAAKAIKTKTQLSTGTVSVSYAAIEWLQKKMHGEVKNILVYGVGKFGRNVAKNIRHYFPNAALAVVNRTDSVAEVFAKETGASWIAFAELNLAVKAANVIIVCTNAGEYTLLPEYFEGMGGKTVLDLSVPLNVHPSVASLPGVSVADVDEVSILMFETMRARKAEVPKAMEMLQEFQQEFFEWLAMYQHSSHIQEMKSKLYSLTGLNLQTCEMADGHLSLPALELHNQVNKTVSNLVVNLRTKKEKGCQFIHAYKHFLEATPVQHSLTNTR